MKSIVMTAGWACLTATALAQADLSVTQVRTCDRAGNVVTPIIGDATYGIRVDFRASQRPRRAYSIRFDMANKSFRFRVTNLRSGNLSAYASFPMPLAGTIPIRVQLDDSNELGERNRTNNLFEGNFTPNEPANSFTLGPVRQLRGSQVLQLDYASLTPGTLTLLMSRPTESTGQGFRDFRTASGTTTRTGGPFGSPVYVRTISAQVRRAVQEQSFVARLQQVTVRPSVANRVTWLQYTNFQSTLQALRLPEGDTIPSNHETVRRFVQDALGENYASRYTPWEASQRLFQAVVQRLERDTVTGSSDVLESLADRRANAYGFARVYVAALRQAGLAARTVAGLKEGTNQWHAWIELWIPGLGYLPQDPWDADILDSTGTYLYCSTTLLDGNSRAAIERHASFVVNSVTYPSILQGLYLQGFSLQPTVTVRGNLVP